MLAVALTVPAAVAVYEVGPSKVAEYWFSAAAESDQTDLPATPEPLGPERSQEARTPDKPAARVAGGARGRPQPGVVFQTAKPKPDPEVVKARRAAEKAAEAASAPFTLRVGTFNVLGSQHTVPGGPRAGYPPASTRTPAAANLIIKHGVDIIGTQELQADQLRGLQARTGMAAYPGFTWGEVETDNSILYDPGMFELVSGDSFTIPFMGRPRPQPIARFRHLATGREFFVVNTHPSAGDGPYLAQRRQGQGALVSVVNNLQESGLPVLVTGDMNDREEFYCRVVPAAGLVASNGGSYASGCRPPPSPLPVDWVVGSGITWSGYWRDTTPVDQRISDHFIISATADVG